MVLKASKPCVGKRLSSTEAFLHWILLKLKGREHTTSVVLFAKLGWSSIGITKTT